MTVPKSVMNVLRTLAALPQDDFQPGDWASLMAARDVAIGEVGRFDRNEARIAQAKTTRQRPKVRKWKPDPPELTAGKRQVQERSSGLCEAMTPVCDRLAVHVHHLARRKGPRCHEAENLMHVCRPCHDWIHDNPEQSYAEGWLRHAPAMDEVRNTKGPR